MQGKIIFLFADRHAQPDSFDLHIFLINNFADNPFELKTYRKYFKEFKFQWKQDTLPHTQTRWQREMLVLNLNFAAALGMNFASSGSCGQNASTEAVLELI